MILRGCVNLNACRFLPKPKELNAHWRSKDFHQQLYETYNDLLSNFVRGKDAHYMFVVQKVSASDKRQKVYNADCFDTWLKLLQACNEEAYTYPAMLSAKDATQDSLVDYRKFVSDFAHFSHVHDSF